MKTHESSFVNTFLVRVAAARVAILFLFHALVFVASYTFACLLRYDFSVPKEFADTLTSSLLLVVTVQLAAGALFGFYRGWWRYVGLADVVRLVVGLSAASALLLAIWYAGPMLGVEPRFVHSPRGVLMIDWAFALLALFGARVMIRLGRDRFRPALLGGIDAVKNVLIIGAGDAGETLAREIEHRPQLGMKVVGFVDDQRAKWGSHIRGIEVYGPIANIGSLADDLGASEALIAIPSASGKRIREIIHHLADADLHFKTIPGIDHIVSGKVHVTQLRPVNVEDLLRRKRIDLPGDPVREMFRGKRVLITGAGGTIGSELASQIAGFAPESLTLVERSEFALYECRKRLDREAAWMANSIKNALADIRDHDVMRAIISANRPHIVLHAAAHKHVPLGEQNAPEYIRNNTIATRRLAELCEENGVERFVFISTDKAINPTSVMGATKRAAEIMLLDLARESAMDVTVVRFGNVIGSSGSVIPLFLEQIAAGGPVTVTHPEVTRYFLRTSEAVSLVLQAATLGDGSCEVFMLDMGEPIRIADLARDLIQLAERSERDIPIVFTGLRPGEKLYEELRFHDETMRPTKHPQIVITEQPQPDRSRVASLLARLEKSVQGDGAFAIGTLRELVPEYVLTPNEKPAPPAAAAPMPRLVAAAPAASAP